MNAPEEIENNRLEIEDIQLDWCGLMNNGEFNKISHGEKRKILKHFFRKTAPNAVDPFTKK